MRHLFLIPACLFLLSGDSFAQLTAAQTSRIVIGGIHLRPTHVEAHRKFWVDALGGQARKIGNNFMAMFPEGFIEIGTPSFGCPPAASTSGVGTCEQKPWGGTRGTNINHVGLSVQDLRAAMTRATAQGYPVVTRAELPPADAKGEKDGIAFRADHKANVAIVQGPDGVLVELVEAPSQTLPVVFHHLHFESPDVAQMIEWYTKAFSGKAAAAGNEAVFPGAVLTFTASADPRVSTRGRILDHFVFEIRDLDSYIKHLKDIGIKFQTPYYKPNLADWGDWRSVFLMDPWGTFVELTQGAYKVH